MLMIDKYDCFVVRWGQNFNQPPCRQSIIWSMLPDKALWFWLCEEVYIATRGAGRYWVGASGISGAS